MKLLVQRRPDDGKAVLGELYVDGVFECYTLEPSANAAYPTTPAGTFPVALLFSPRFGETTPHIQNVPGRSFIEMHPGNDPADTEGCTLVGETETTDWVGSSRVAFKKLMAKLETAAPGSITVEYADPSYPDVDGEIAT